VSAEEKTNENVIEFTVERIYKIPAREPNRFGEFDVAVLVRDSRGQFHTVKIPEKEFSEEKLVEAVKKEVLKYSKFIGKKFSIKIS